MSCPYTLDKIHQWHSHVDMSGELPEQKLIQQAVHEGDRILEFGTNIGRSTIVASSCTGPNGHVMTFESNADDRKTAEKNARNLNNITFNPAVSDVPLYQWGWYTSTVKESPEWKPVEIVPMSTMDGKWDTVIADCEGCFSDIVAKRPQILEHTRSIVLENDDPDLERQARLHATLSDMGFKSVSCAPHPNGSVRNNFKHDKCFFELLTR